MRKSHSWKEISELESSPMTRKFCFIAIFFLNISIDVCEAGRRIRIRVGGGYYGGGKSFSIK